MFLCNPHRRDEQRSVRSFLWHGRGDLIDGDISFESYVQWHYNRLKKFFCVNRPLVSVLNTVFRVCPCCTIGGCLKDYRFSCWRIIVALIIAGIFVGLRMRSCRQEVTVVFVMSCSWTLA